MSQANSLLTGKLFLNLSLELIAILAVTQHAAAQNSWLDRPLVNWNRQDGGLPQLPQPLTPQGEFANADRCRQQARKPASAAENALIRHGWLLYGPVYSYDSTKVVTALSGFDGMCRPLGYQAFVYWEGRYAGTLSPVPMNSRSDAALKAVHLSGPTSFSADFARYKESDALCCPSRVDSVVYNLQRDDIPTLTAASVTPNVTCHTSDSTNSGPDVFEKKWTLSEMENRKFSSDEPNIEFDPAQKRASGSSGCNRFTSTFQIDGSMLKFSPIAGTRRACADAELQRVETSFLKLLGSTTRFEVRGNTLFVFANEALILVFTSK